MFTHNFEEKKTGEASIKDITAGTFNKLLEYIYTGEVSDLNSIAEDLLRAANKYEILLLKEMCEISLCKTLNHDNAVRRMDLADMHDAPYLIDYIIKCIMLDPLKIIESKDKDPLSVYVWNLEENSVKAFVTIFILNNKQEKSNIWEFGEHLFEDGKSWGYNDFVKKERLLDKKYELIPNDILTVCTEITVVDENIQNPVKGSYQYSNYQLVEDFKELYKSRAFSDMVINVGEEKLQAHRNILMTRSPVLASMINLEMTAKNVNEVVITDISLDTFEKLLEYIYTDEESDLEKDAAELLEAADKYQLASLKKRYKEWLCESLNPENALKMLDLADRFSAPYLMEYVIKYITADAAKIVESEEFKEYEKSNPFLGLRLFKEFAVAFTWDKIFDTLKVLLDPLFIFMNIFVFKIADL
ncbi:Similar to spop: Speckle-type POZ protein (Xenopus tropicalis) [Cotesia congregata]|uniref:Similar to spop: Speckle-type POZ protein (Xenopus tropicalis) n=1 Tax=Cotesia congregata TaxID=51543 RepID=A0A8J2MQI0_COTCN|nr:Similar to spop: Speckle-type POZ protein (Xenopus tropicalis) [Cotesia congregata]